MKTWLHIDTNSDFSIHNLPFGIFSTATLSPRAGVAIGDQIIDLSRAAALGLLPDVDVSTLEADTLNAFISLGKKVTNGVRLKLQSALCDDSSSLRADDQVLVSMTKAKMHMPVSVGDYTDFYSSIEHATNVGKMFRDPANALLPNWKHLPVGYHGRSSSLIVSETPIHRPKGQKMPPNADKPVYGPSVRLDIELEMGFIIGKESQLGDPISTADASEYIFGMVVFNDWSARDIQKWEYVPLGPFLGKNFASSLSPWIVTMEALEPFRLAGPVQDVPVLPYLEYEGAQNYDIQLEVDLTTPSGDTTTICRSNFKYMYWNMLQQLTHHTVNGCNVRVGDLMASGTISGKDESSYGSLLEMSWSGTKPIPLNNGETRTFLEDGDHISMRGFCEKDGIRVGFGSVNTEILPAK